MTDEQLLVRLADREDNYTERKPDGVKPEEIRQTVCAFSNSLTAGATAVLYIGIHDKTGAVLGVDNSDMVQKRVREAIDRCYPSITNYAMRVLDVGGKTVVAMKVGASDNRPHFTGPAFIRRGSESVTASEQIFQQMVASRNSKTARILRMRGGVISFQSIGHRIGDTKVITDKAYHEGGGCRRGLRRTSRVPVAYQLRPTRHRTTGSCRNSVRRREESRHAGHQVLAMNGPKV